MTLKITKAKRMDTTLKLGIAGPAGSGKTQGSLLLGFGQLQAAHPKRAPRDIWEKICIIDTENRSGNLYAGASINGLTVGEFLTIDLEPPFSPQRYMEAMRVAEDNGVEFVIIDSLSHAWTGEGGMLDMQNTIAKKTGNSYTAGRDVSPQHARLVDKILQSSMHVVVTLRTKTEYILEENDRGKKTPRKVGTAPIFRDGLEYELTIFFELGQDHNAMTTKDRTGLFDGRVFLITPKIGETIHEWLASADSTPASPMPVITPENKEPLSVRVDNAMKAYCAGLDAGGKQLVADKIKEITGGTANYRNVTDDAVLQQILDAFGKEDMT